ncbi:MAG TPA: hypothetical protein VGO69_11535 [Pyrinomonadaceae bacterium]|jgi:hypothetical protein|nr:hypothetical protein [Pyrinomonadaceae bacterium]
MKDNFGETVFQKDIGWHITDEPVELSGCSIDWRKEYKYKSGSISYTKLHVQLVELEPSSARVETFATDNIYGVLVAGGNKKQVVKYDIGDGQGWRYSSGEYIYYNNQALAERFARALKHAIELCKAREPF